jgi:hypothetical protein
MIQELQQTTTPLAHTTVTVSFHTEYRTNSLTAFHILFSDITGREENRLQQSTINNLIY